MSRRTRIRRSGQLLAVTIAFTMALIGGADRVRPCDGQPHPLHSFPLASAADPAIA